MTDASVITLFREKGIRPTPQRVEMYQYLLTHPVHPTAEMIHDSLKLTCSLMTVYNGLDALLDAGLVRLVTIEPGVKRFDATVREHGHFRCRRCGTLYDFPVTAENMQIAALDGFEVLDHDLYCAGICPDCQAVKQQ